MLKKCYQFGNIFYFCTVMRVIAVKTLRNFWISHPSSKQPLLAWSEEMEKGDWKVPTELKSTYRNASLITGKRVVFNIHGNEFRLIVDIEYRLQIVFIVWIGTHKEYDKINAKTIAYDNKTHKK